MKMTIIKLTVSSVFLLSCLTLFSGCSTEKTLFFLSGKNVETWADNYDSSDPGTLTIRIEQNGIVEDEQTITDAGTVNQVFSALSSIRIKDNPDKGPIDFMIAPTSYNYTFTASDGNSVSFLFLDKLFAVGDPINSNGLLYTCTGTDSLFAIQGGKKTMQSDTPQESSFFTFFSDDQISEFAASFYTSKPGSFSYTFNGMAAGDPIVISDPDEITAVYEALSAISIAEESEIASTDNDHIFEFDLTDGKSVSFRFNMHNLEWKGKYYILENDEALWDFVKQISSSH